ncbi:Os09g0325140 [Oryza sativa Japonica Group]|uniref:Os09g0325140 protein n=1 Tax=Oryza sativa subsp. japonica TaxID=39947 RepID=A0A0P0XL05_ORYSJ|nr:hypothetical protein EE612_046980 [Oryza sativa]BAT07475.1 Os09g0325140 [Oryza sativa Japonica Group]
MLATHHADEIPAGFEFEDCVVRECMPPTTDEVPAGFESEDFVVIVDGVGGLILSLPALLIGACAAAAVAAAGDGCRAGCSLAIAAYYFSEGSNLTFIATIFAIGGGGYQALLPYNPAITNPDYVVTGDRVFVFPCSCLGLPAAPASTFLAGAIPYPLPLPRGGGGDTYDAVAANFANLTTAAWLEATRAGSPAMEGSMSPSTAHAATRGSRRGTGCSSHTRSGMGRRSNRWPRSTGSRRRRRWS